MAVSPQLEEFNRKLVKEKRLTLKLLSDPGNRVARKFNLAYKLPEDLRKVYLASTSISGGTMETIRGRCPCRHAS